MGDRVILGRKETNVLTNLQKTDQKSHLLAQKQLAAFQGAH